MSDTPAARRWRALLDEHRTSGLTYRAFAQSRHVNPSTFAWWRCELRRRDADAQVPTPTFTALTVAKPRRNLTLRLDEYAAHVVVDADTDLDLLGRLLAALA